jgi:two-component system, chemotaxis family, response regulator Rcp1
LKKMMGSPVEILLVEDNPGDVRLITEVFKEAKVSNKLRVVMDGEEALKMLRREGEYSDMPLPDFILLDLNLPKKSGGEVLKEMRQDLKLRCIPVVILTTSSSDEDIINTYRNCANSFITKPVDLNQFIEVVKSIQNFWLTIVKLPQEC